MIFAHTVYCKISSDVANQHRGIRRHEYEDSIQVDVVEIDCRSLNRIRV
jgi:hypothetical protein